jgi:hypothetical protein
MHQVVCQSWGQILTDSEAGYEHSIILVSSDDNSVLMSISMLGQIKMRGLWPGACGRACSNLFGFALPWKPMNARDGAMHETHALSRFASSSLQHQPCTLASTQHAPSCAASYHASSVFFVNPLSYFADLIRRLRCFWQLLMSRHASSQRSAPSGLNDLGRRLILAQLRAVTAAFDAPLSSILNALRSHRGTSGMNRRRMRRL